jgi:hypothetical protein
MDWIPAKGIICLCELFHRIICQLGRSCWMVNSSYVLIIEFPLGWIIIRAPPPCFLHHGGDMVLYCLVPAVFIVSVWKQVAPYQVTASLNSLMMVRGDTKSVSIPTGFGLNGRDSITGTRKIFLFTTSRPLWGLPSYLSNGYRGLFPRR